MSTLAFLFTKIEKHMKLGLELSLDIGIRQPKSYNLKHKKSDVKIINSLFLPHTPETVAANASQFSHHRPWRHPRTTAPSCAI